MITPCLTFLGTDKLFSKADALFNIPDGNVREFRFLHNFNKPAFVCLFVLTMLVGVKWYLMVLICIFLMSNYYAHFLCVCYLPFVCFLWRTVFIDP